MKTPKTTKTLPSLPPIAYIFILLGFGFGNYWLYPKLINPSETTPPQFLGKGIAISTGQKVLIAEKLTPNKQAGVESFAKRDWKSAAAEFKKSLQQNSNDPEALIYSNNAKIGDDNSLKIAVSVPIGSNLNVAQEILRGVAQAQDEVNRSGGINGVPLKVAIADDQNNPEIAINTAREFIDVAQILAVVGHNSSEATLAATSVYQRAGLVSISPTSNAINLSNTGSYFYRTVPNIRAEASVLTKYASKTKRLLNIAICADSTSSSSQSLRAEFTDRFTANGGRIANTPCDFAAKDFSPDLIIPKLISEGADGLLLLPNIDKINMATDMAIANQGRLSLMGSSVMYTNKTLQLGQKDVNGMVVDAIWHPDSDPANPFAKNAAKLWNGSVNWRTATSYDATLAIFAGLRQNPTRKGLQHVISQYGFSINGATGKVKFLPSGDRMGDTILLKVHPSNSSTGYDFTPML